MLDYHEAIVGSLTPGDWDLPGSLSLETVAHFGELLADEIEAAKQVGVIDEPADSATGIDEKHEFRSRLPDIAAKLICPPIGWIEYQSGFMGNGVNYAQGRLALVARWFWSIERALQCIAVWGAELGRRVMGIATAPQHCTLAPAYGNHPTLDPASRDCLCPNAYTLMLQEIALKVQRLLRSENAPEALPLPTFGLLDSLIPPAADGIDYPLYGLIRQRLRDAVIVHWPSGDWRARILSPALSANDCLP